MAGCSQDDFSEEHNVDGGEDLRQALMRLTSPQVEVLQQELVQLKEQIDIVGRLEGDTAELQKKLNEVSHLLKGVETKSRQLGDELRDPSMIGQRLETTIVPALHWQINHRTDDVAETLAPVIGPAMRRQIRDAKDDIIDALYPVIGQIINKAIAEALRELTRSIDTRLRQQLNFRGRLNQSIARLRGVSEAELFLRDSLPYSIERVFLIHRETGLLLSHISAESDARLEVSTISGMLTAIQDFVRDSFSGGEGDLEEIIHGGRRILLEGGQRAYVAVVLNGVEPEGYNSLIRDTVSNINVQYENELKKFEGNMERLPDFRRNLDPLLNPGSSLSTPSATDKPLSSSQKRIIGLTLAGALLLIAALIFACIFVISLWPVAFPKAMSIPAPTSTPFPSLTPTLLPTFTPTTITSTQTPTLVPTFTSTTLPPSTAPLPVGVLTGNLNVRAEPSKGSPSLGVIFAGEKVIIKDQQGIWYLIRWPVEGEPNLEGWINGETFLDLPKDFLP